ncbi:hypothetical protein C2845_PM03G33570 [Panicum miliaceum]|uniref:Uncharacterized protein n=1 Tax=Panicum miliaceum TaxID=4540 RepID=A0A3L6T6E1_PANMI|nr:hypothetical protein C2845_PM03G33570 [Panicum miliaceum]
MAQEDREEAGAAARQGGGEDAERHRKAPPTKIHAGRHLPLALRPRPKPCLPASAVPNFEGDDHRRAQVQASLSSHQNDHSRLGLLRQGQL